MRLFFLPLLWVSLKFDVPSPTPRTQRIARMLLPIFDVVPNFFFDVFLPDGLPPTSRRRGAFIWPPLSLPLTLPLPMATWFVTRSMVPSLFPRVWVLTPRC